MNHEMIDGRAVLEKIFLPEGQTLVLFSPSLAPNDLHFDNHNIFLLDHFYCVVWQVRRDEQGKLKWDAMHEQARSSGKEGAREPFKNLLVIQPDGTRKRNPLNDRPLERDIWGARLSGVLHEHQRPKVRDRCRHWRRAKHHAASSRALVAAWVALPVT